MSAIQNDLNLSNTQTLKLAGHLRSATSSRAAIQPNFKRDLQQKNHVLDFLFSSENQEFLGKGSEVVIKPFVHCNDINLLVHTVQQLRGKVYNNMKIGIDTGGGSLKVCLTLNSDTDVDEEPHQVTKRQSHAYAEGVAARTRSDNSVKRLFIIGLIPDIPENYRNVLLVWTLLKLDQVSHPFTIAVDLKLANIIVGLMAHGSCHPCTWCEVSKDNLLVGRHGSSRTLGSIRQMFWKWHGSGEEMAEAKNFGNVVHLPIPKQSDDTALLNLIPPPELHLLIGPMTTLLDALKSIWPEVDEWANRCNVERQAYHGGVLNGNSCLRLLKNVHLLEEMQAPRKYVYVFQRFNKVVQGCYGMSLSESFDSDIDGFFTAYKTLGIRITPKVHAVAFHVKEFCSFHHKGLGFWSEQASEAVHSDFEKIWQRYKVGQQNSKYGNQLLKAVQDY